MEKYKHTLKIAGTEYIVISEEEPEYMDELARDIDAKISAALKSGKLSITQAAILAALDYADAAKKNGASSDNLRSQLKAYLEDAAQAKSERDFYKRELDKISKNSGSEDPGRKSLW